MAAGTAAPSAGRILRRHLLGIVGVRHELAIIGKPGQEPARRPGSRKTQPSRPRPTTEAAARTAQTTRTASSTANSPVASGRASSARKSRRADCGPPRPSTSRPKGQNGGQNQAQRERRFHAVDGGQGKVVVDGDKSLSQQAFRTRETHGAGQPPRLPQRQRGQGQPQQFGLEKDVYGRGDLEQQAMRSRWSGLEKPSTRSPMLKTGPCPASRLAA